MVQMIIFVQSLRFILEPNGITHLQALIHQIDKAEDGISKKSS